MKRFGCAAACALAAAGAQAQSAVTIYGNIDVAATWGESGRGTTLPGGTVSSPASTTYKRLDSGVGPGSRLGFRGREDLGSGLTAVYLMEMGFALDTGALQQGGSAFGRQVYVGIEGKTADVNWSVTAGRQYSPLNFAFGFTDAMYGLYWGNSYSSSGLGVYESIGDAAGNNFGAAARVDNSIVLKASSGGLLGRLMVSAGNENTRGTGRLINPQIEYSAGPLLVTATAVRYRQNAGSLNATASPVWRSIGLIGASYDLKFVKLAGGYYEARTPGDPANLSPVATVGAAGSSPFSFSWQKLKMPYVGATVPLPRGSLSVDLSALRYKFATGADGKSYALGSVYQYPLSKRTSLYASYAYIKNDERSRTPMLAAISAILPNGFGADPKVLSVGMQHSF